MAAKSQMQHCTRRACCKLVRQPLLVEKLVQKEPVASLSVKCRRMFLDRVVWVSSLWLGLFLAHVNLLHS